MTGFTLRSKIADVELIASGKGIRILAWIRRVYGKGRWRKPKARAWWSFQVVRSSERNCIGTKLTESVEST